MAKKIRFEVKEKIVSLTGACFWYWNNFYSFLDSCGVSRTIYKLYPKETYNKYDVMRSILEYLENKNDIDTINNIISNYYKMKNAIDKDNLDNFKAQELLKEFKILVGTDPIENEIQKLKQKEHNKNRDETIKIKHDFHKNIEELNK